MGGVHLHRCGRDGMNVLWDGHAVDVGFQGALGESRAAC